MYSKIIGLNVNDDQTQPDQGYSPCLADMLLASTRQADHRFQLEDGRRVIAQLAFSLH